MIFFKKICFLLVLVLFNNVQAQTEETILWKPGVKLTWSNFKENAPVSNRVAAITASGINYKYTTSFKNNSASFTFEIGAFFYPNKSWYKKDLCTDITLSHEQLHFDITELHARLFRQRITLVKPHEGLANTLQDMHSAIDSQLADMQNAYDLQSEYSINVVGQKKWKDSIATQLKVLNKFKSKG